MSEWIMAHPWMTFFLAALALLVIDSAISNICKMVSGGKDNSLPPPPGEEDAT